MIHIALPSDVKRRRLPFYLAMEEWVARHLPDGEYFFTWVVNPTVICGRNQDIAAEVDLEYCRTHGIEVVRRKSGGGCVYADEDNIMISHIVPSRRQSIQTSFAEYTSKIADMLKNLGLDAKATGRNDVLIGDRKVSGNAFFHIPGRSIMHGTMLVSTNMTNMLQAITPSRAKLTSKMVQSVASRITTINEYFPEYTVEAFRKYIEHTLASAEIVLASEHVKQIEEIELGYYAHEWLFPETRRHRNTVVKEEHIPGVGLIKIYLKENQGKIAGVNMSGDFFVLSDIDSLLLNNLIGVEYKPEAINEALSDVDVSTIISGLTTSRFIQLLTTP